MPSGCAMLTGVRSSIARVIAVLFAVGLLAGCAAGLESGAGTASVAPASQALGQDQYATSAPAQPTTDLPTMPIADLPPEEIDTLVLIADGGRILYSQDGSTFNNREQILPQAPSGFYAEYTVVTPGSDDRGARRIVAGDDGSRFYTEDHYDSFREVVSR